MGFGGHVEPLDRDDPAIAAHGLLVVSALRELVEETGLRVAANALAPVGFINSDAQDVSSVHFGGVFRIDLDGLDGSDEDLLATVSAQAEPERALWLPEAGLRGMAAPGAGPDGGDFEDWSRIVIAALA